MKFITIVGARPQFVKAAALSRILKETGSIHEIIIHTGQHYDANMYEVFFEQLAIPVPDYNLGIANLSHGAMTGRMLESIDHILQLEKPDRVIVFGDTNSTLAAVLASAKLHIPVAHIEAGLRSFNMVMPEEINRIVADRLSDRLFCPTRTAVENLYAEGFNDFPDVKIIQSGDVMLDASLYYADRCRPPQLHNDDFNFSRPFALVTIHRAENTDSEENLSDIFKALIEISLDLPLLIPLHPRTRNRLSSLDPELKKEIFSQPERVHVMEPVGYLEMIFLLRHCSIVLTDSGGLQKEAFFFNKPCVTLREETEWVELVDNDFNKLAGHHPEKIVHSCHSMLHLPPRPTMELYGNGNACKTIVDNLLRE